jgi:cytochrome P450
VKRHGRKCTRKDLLAKLIAPHCHEIGMECGNLVFAGTDTASTTLTNLFWELSQRVEWQDSLRNELDSISLTDRVASYRDVNNLKVLDAVITEALRLHPAAPASLPRECPTRATELGGYKIPAGVCNHLVSRLAHSHLDCYFYAMLHYSARPRGLPRTRNI